MPADISYVRDLDVIGAEVGAETILLNSRTWTYADFNPVAARIWELLSEPHTIDQLVARLGAEFDVEDATCRSQTVAFLDDIVREGFVSAR